VNTPEAVQVLVKVLTPYVGDTMARSATEAHCQKLGIADGALSPEQLEALLAKLGSGLNIFLGRDRSTVVIAEARAALAAGERR
jgi:hypothetical protein